MSCRDEQLNERSRWQLLGVSLLRSYALIAAAMFFVEQNALRISAADKPPEVLEAVRKSMGFFKDNLQNIGPAEFGLVAYACLSAGESPDSPLVKPLIEKVLAKFESDGYKATQHHNYEAGVDAMALAAADKQKYRGQLQLIANYLIANQLPNGGWDYLGQDHGGDTSISQYGMLGLWAAARAGVDIPIKPLDQIASWHLKTQLKNGAWSYQPYSGDNTMKHSMTVAGIGTLGVARLLTAANPRDLEALVDEPETKTKKNEKAFGVLEKVTTTEDGNQPTSAKPANEGPYKPQVTQAGMDAAMRRGLGWLGTNYTVDKNALGWHLYYLYGMERAASLANVDKIAGHDWYVEGYRVLLKLQDQDGGWRDAIGSKVSSTCFAVLFLMRATEKLVPISAPKPTAAKVTVGGGILSGGRGLPSDLANVDTKGGQVTAKKMDTPIDKLLAVLENPKSQQVESAQAALVEAVLVGKREELVGQKDLLVKLAKDSRLEVRRTAFWALGRCGDLRVAPLLIQGLMDPEYDVAVEARNSLCLLSRRPRGFGLPEDVLDKLPETAPQAERDSVFEKWHREDVRRWKDWYQSVRPYDERDRLPE